jgi:hypothetical protein
MLNFEKVSTQYCITVPLEDFCSLIEFENDCRAYETLYSKLRDIGVESDYDGHYSSSISITIDDEDDNCQFKADIACMITEQLKNAIDWKKLLDKDKI